ncbi:TonB-dependent receptor family protein [Pseudoalteromonas denitrificans]|uniref:Fe(3+) dicitrate transport protein n=1 Tax=Pseudoalteromonas denitrificans DSM 6059 TaxID=1123010 RepID=A0A1I1FMV5_9GAMM|nr:TonB-dependent receptor [Pseudoalteromonas denitrificans]SFC00322.1 Fe(3+) dicitrate transport protein [Pseudoalteromonas denitrificans DSM 6059]
MKKTILALSVATLLNPLNVTADEKEVQVQSKAVEHMQIISHSDKLRTESGSATLLTELELEKHEYDDIHRILASVPGVNIREEDGFGLRPNIGFRGVNPERSKKITILEDGILIGPAPYSAPAAYYFPVTTRMSAVEVFKGPAAIKYGPQTVAGTLNLVTRQVPIDSEGAIDLSLGSEGYAKAHAYFGETHDDIGVLVEAVHLEADGFKELDGGGDTGFEKNDILAKFNYLIDGDKFDQKFELKLSYADELSDETYLGLTDTDFKENPYRRYAASQPAQMDTEHKQVMFTHNLSSDDINITTRIYRNEYQRAWRKLNGLTNTDLSISEILDAPEEHQRQYQVISGGQNSIFNGETPTHLIMGTNDRSYFSQGIQFNADFGFNLFNLEHDISVGVRVHEDEINRNHFEENYEMQDGFAKLVEGSAKDAAQNIESTKAVSIYLEDSVTINNLTVSAGLRGEYMDMHYNDKVDTTNWQDKTTRILLPGLSGFYKLSENSGLLAGIYQGFSPTSPQQKSEIKVEKSINYEFGGRYNNDDFQAEVVSFFNNYSNLKASCSQSSCSDANDLDTEFNAGEVHVYGLEAQFRQSYSLNSQIDMPVSLVYTYTESEFKEEIYSEFEQWGHVKPGDELPYLANNQATLNLGLDANNWQVNLSIKYVGAMTEASGTSWASDDKTTYVNVIHEGQSTDNSIILDFSASYELGDYGKVYGKIDNLTDEVKVVSRIPYGARPGKPRLFSVGYKYQF